MAHEASLRLTRVLTTFDPMVLALPAVLLIGTCIRAAILGSGQFDYDEGVYWESLRAMVAGHPLFSSVYSSQPPTFLLLLVLPHLIGGGSLLADRAAIVGLSLAGIVAAHRVGSLLVSRWTGLAAATLLSADPLFFQQSVTLQADAPAVALALVALGLAADSRTRAGRSASVLAACAGGLAAACVSTKLLAIPVLPALAIVLAAPPLRGPGAAGRLGCAGLGAAAVATGLMLPFLDRWPLLWAQVIELRLHARMAAIGGLDFSTVVAELPLAILGIAGFLIAARRAPLLALASATWALAAITLLLIHRPLWSHHALILVAPLALLGGVVGGLVRGTPNRMLAALTVLLVGGLTSALLVEMRQTPDVTRQRSMATLREVTAPGDFVITDDQFTAALANRDTPPELVDTSKVRVLSGDLTTQELAAIADRSDVRVILLDQRYDSLRELPGFQEWVRSEYPHSIQLDSGRIIYLKTAPRPWRDDRRR